jgi:putative inorganic carbon (HCO3(-)) transporter
MLRDHPWKGLGLDQFLGEYGRRYVRREGWDERYTSHPHNVLLDFWLSLGIAGVIWLWAALELGANQIMAVLHMGRCGVPRAGAAMLCAGFAHGLLDNSFFLPDLATWTWIGLVMISTPKPEPST